MDCGNGRFEQFDIPKEAGQNEAFEKLFKQKETLLFKLYPNHGGIFSEGEELEIKGSRFRISKIIHNGMKLELLPKL
jgi:hypothetical protein